ncbi:MAG TPA: FkbM family methyltransferase [Desulfobacterales bacterium]|nr:FkbM family methyltransferase [Desulfobacterales bacterium]
MSFGTIGLDYKKREYLINKLSSAVCIAKKNRLNKFIASPWKMAYPKLLSIINRGRKVKAQTFWGEEMNVWLPEPVSKSIWRHGYFEEDVCLAMLYYLERGMTFIDVGAHIGFFTLLGSYLVGREGKVLSFEPTPSTYRLLKKNVANCPNVCVYNCAAFSEETNIKFYDYGLEKSSYNSAFGIRMRGYSPKMQNEITVMARKVDNVVKEEECREVNFIKIDAESSEMHVLSGLTETIREYRPYIIIEVGDFKIDGVPNSREVVAWLEKRGYIPHEIQSSKFVRHRKKAFYEYMNLLFIPR